MPAAVVTREVRLRGGPVSGWAPFAFRGRSSESSTDKSVHGGLRDRVGFPAPTWLRSVTRRFTRQKRQRPLRLRHLRRAQGTPQGDSATAERDRPKALRVRLGKVVTAPPAAQGQSPGVHRGVHRNPPRAGLQPSPTPRRPSGLTSPSCSRSSLARSWGAMSAFITRAPRG